MTVRFAAARNPARSPVARALAYGPVARPANDNDFVAAFDDGLLAALRHFGRHGLAAKSLALANAEAARAAGDEPAVHRWTEICNALDPVLRRRSMRTRSHGGS